MATKDVNIQIEQRTEKGNGPSRRMRRTGRVPAIIYGHGEPALPVMLTELASKQIQHHTGLVTLNMAGESMLAILKDVQRHCISGATLHMDFQKVRADEVITVSVRIEPTGVPAGIQAGGQLEQVLHTVEIKCRASEIFEVLTVDVSGMNLNDTLHVADVKLPEGATAATAGAAAIFQVRMPKMTAEVAEVAAVEGETPAAGEPEVIAKGKKDEEDGAAPAAGAKGAAPAKGAAAPAKGAPKAGGEKKK